MFQINEIFALLQSNPIQQFSLQNNVKQKNKAKKHSTGRKFKKIKKIQFYPSPGALPNLMQGYLFNKERNLLKKGKKASSVNSVKIDDVYYAGSIITNNEKVALIFYEKQKSSQKKYVKTRGKKATSSGNNLLYKKLNISDSIGDYTVAQILPDRLILENNGSKLEKLLNDEDKPEIQPPVKTARKKAKNTQRNRTTIRNRKKPIRPKRYNFKRR